MTYFLFQTALVTSIALTAGTLIGWWLHHYYGKEKKQSVDNDLNMVKNYLAESIRETARLKLQLKISEEKVVTLSNNKSSVVQGIDFEAYQTFEKAVKEAQMRKYLN